MSEPRVRVVTLYRRAGCHLCDDARRIIRAIAEQEGGIELREVDIDTDAALLAAHLERIPVLEVDGEVISELEPDPHDLRRRLHTVGQ